MKFPKDHPYMIRLDVALQESKFATLFATHGEYCEDMKEEILNALFHPPEEIRPNTPKTIMGSADFDELPRYDFSEQKYTDD
tara:strand:+ start:200 stop:445 length:246 start_codon:yes stop_codon:yes gene_type:complete